jgi:hypothetical protein
VLDLSGIGVNKMSRFIKKPLIMMYASSLLLLTTSCSSVLVERIKAMEEAHNSGDVEEEMSFFADDVRCDFSGSFVINGKEDLRKAVEANSIFNSRMTFTDCKESGNTVTCKVTEHNDMLKAAGLGPVYYEVSEHIFENGLIKELKARPAEENVRALKEFREGFGKWISETRPQDSTELKTVGITKENVNKWLTLIRQWREETK